MQQSENINELAKALNQAQGEIRGAVKDAANPFFKSRYANLESIIDATRDQLAKYGLSVTQPIGCDDEGREFVYTQIMHNSGQWIRSKMLVKTKDASPQAQGSSVSYCRRYALQAILNVPTIEDDDGETAQQAYRKPTFIAPPSQPIQSKPITNLPKVETVPLKTPETPLETPTSAVAATSVQLNRISYLLNKTKLDPIKVGERIQKQFGKSEIKLLDKSEAEWLIKSLEGIK